MSQEGPGCVGSGLQPWWRGRVGCVPKAGRPEGAM